jgi:tRNA (guanine37-N1)-methyltransferase
MPVAFDAISIFPEMFAALTQAGVTRRALADGLWDFQCWNPRDFADNTARTIDDRPYGGGPGMVMEAAPLEKAINAARARQQAFARQSQVVYLSPQGAPLTHGRVMAFAEAARSGVGLVLLCGRYEGVDERVVERCVDAEVSLGDFVLSGGELAAMALMDAVLRQIPGVLGDEDSAAEDSFATGLLDHPHYTRPEVYEGMKVPEVLLSGDHARIRAWRHQMALERTRQRRPDLLREAHLA